MVEVVLQTMGTDMDHEREDSDDKKGRYWAALSVGSYE